MAQLNTENMKHHWETVLVVDGFTTKSAFETRNEARKAMRNWKSFYRNNKGLETVNYDVKMYKVSKFEVISRVMVGGKDTNHNGLYVYEQVR